MGTHDASDKSRGVSLQLALGTVLTTSINKSANSNSVPSSAWDRTFPKLCFDASSRKRNTQTVTCCSGSPTDHAAPFRIT